MLKRSLQPILQPSITSAVQPIVAPFVEQIENAAEIAMQTKANRIKRFLPDEAPKFDIKDVIHYTISQAQKGYLFKGKHGHLYIKEKLKDEEEEGLIGEKNEEVNGKDLTRTEIKDQ